MSSTGIPPEGDVMKVEPPEPVTILGEAIPDGYICLDQQDDFYLSKSIFPLSGTTDVHVYFCTKFELSESTNFYDMTFFGPEQTTQATIPALPVMTATEDPDICDICKPLIDDQCISRPSDADIRIAHEKGNTPVDDINPPTVGCPYPSTCPGFNTDSQCVELTGMQKFCSALLEPDCQPNDQSSGVRRMINEKRWGGGGFVKGHGKGHGKVHDNHGDGSNSSEENECTCTCPICDETTELIGTLIDSCEAVFES